MSSKYMIGVEKFTNAWFYDSAMISFLLLPFFSNKVSFGQNRSSEKIKH
jgi:hypothetical protein